LAPCFIPFSRLKLLRTTFRLQELRNVFANCSARKVVLGMTGLLGQGQTEILGERMKYQYARNF
jgi:hypothetical protein